MKEHFLMGVIAGPVVAIIVVFAMCGGACELACNQIGYTIISNIVGPNSPSSEAHGAVTKLSWLCAGFRIKKSGQWGYSGKHDQAACLELYDVCAGAEKNACDDWKSIQNGMIGWGEENDHFFSRINPTHKIISTETLVGNRANQKRLREDRIKKLQLAIENQKKLREVQLAVEEKKIEKLAAKKEKFSRATKPRNPKPSLRRNPLIIQLEQASDDMDSKAFGAAFLSCTDSLVASANAGLTDRVIRDVADLVAILRATHLTINGKEQVIRNFEEAIAGLKQAKQQTDAMP